MGIEYPSRAENSQLIDFVNSQIYDSELPDDTQCIAVVRDGKVAAVAAYYNYRGTSIEMAFVSTTPRWASRQVIDTLLGFPFAQLRVQRITALCRPGNKRIRRLLNGIGFRYEGRLRRADVRGKDLVIYGYLDNDYVSRMSNGRQATTSTTTSTEPARNRANGSGIQPDQSGHTVWESDVFRPKQKHRNPGPIARVTN